MGSDDFVRVVIHRLAAALLIALLSGPGVASGPRAVPDVGPPASGQGTGMDAAPGPVVSTIVSLAPVPSVAPLAAVGRVLVTSDLPVSGRPAPGPHRTTLAAKPAPTVLRI
jgi:hypothetical protein